MPKVVVTGGAGFIGSAVIRLLIEQPDVHIVNVDKLTYAANPATLRVFERYRNYSFEHVDIVDPAAVSRVFQDHAPDIVMHLAAESHVDRSIDAPGEFIQTNIVGTYALLQAALRHYEGLQGVAREQFRFHHISTDEVFGALGDTGLFEETTPYNPSSPYSASKASSDHLARAWHHTFGLPVVVTNCSNNYGPYQFPEKLIPLMIANAVAEKPLPVYGTGQNVRDWLYVDDHARALWLVASKGAAGETYNIGGHNECSNIHIVETICDLVDARLPRRDGSSRRDLIKFVADRPGHDFRYAIDASKIERELGWRPQETLETGLNRTIDWYLENTEWLAAISRQSYDGGRLGVRQSATS